MRLSAVAGAALVVLGTAILCTMARGPRPTIVGHGSSATLTPTLGIEPFGAPDSVGVTWNPVSFAESLAAHLERMPGLEVRVAGSRRDLRTEFTVRGVITKQAGRLVIVSRLYEEAADPPIWTATLWRDSIADSAIVEELAADMAEALYGHLARSSVTRNRGRQ